MRTQLDILALEPFYGGVRRAMLNALMRCSRHRWTLLKLPPRRIERRLAAASNWFAEQLCQHFSGQIDLLFTSEAMNLSNLHRLVPDLASRPSVCYFHDNHLPHVDAEQEGAFDLVNLNTAAAATEIWFNSTFHLRTFLARATALVARHPELSNHDPMPAIIAKAQLVPPPMDLSAVAQVRGRQKIDRDPAAIFVETRDANVRLLNAALQKLHSSGRQFRLITVGPVEQLSDRWPRHTVREMDDVGQIASMLESTVMLSAKPEATFDYLWVRGALAGCRLLAPATGIYPDLLPPALHDNCLYAPDPAALAHKLTAALNGNGNGNRSEPPDWRRVFRELDAISACRHIDERLERLAKSRIAVTA